MNIADTLLPVLLLIVLGRVLASWKFLGDAFSADLNKLVFWVALPCLLFRSSAAAGVPTAAVGRLFLVLLVATLAGWLVAWLAVRLAGIPASQSGSCLQAAFRGNLAYIGIPVLTYAAGTQEKASSLPDLVVVMTLTMVLYNALAVWVLGHGRQGVRKILQGIATNPLLIAGLAGVAWGSLGLPLPLAIDRTLQTLGSASVPLALLCIGGALHPGKAGGRWAGTAIAVTVKVLVVPACAGLTAWWLGLSGFESLGVVVLAACPTAAASYVMAVRSGGDGPLTAAAISLGTVLAFPALAVILWIYRAS